MCSSRLSDKPFKDPDTKREIQSLLGNDDRTELEARLRHRMSFGTAGLRARMGAGYSRMNCLTVIQTSQGLAQYIRNLDKPSVNKSVVIGYDVRKNSKQFAELAATAFTKKSFKVFFYEDYVHTPLVPFAVKLLGAAAGVMVTASHNPAHDNGYKVYWGPLGCQINSPHDVGIAKSILHDDSLKPISWNTMDLLTDPNLKVVMAHVFENYYEAVYRLAKWPEHVRAHTRFIYTPIHGTGLVFMRELAQRLGYYDDMVVVEAQVLWIALYLTVADLISIHCRPIQMQTFQQSSIRIQRRLVLLIWHLPQQIETTLI